MPCKRMAPALLALLLPLSLAALAGCGGSEGPEPPPPPPPAALSGEAGLAGLSISLGELTPAFSPGVDNYSATVGYLGEQSIGVTVTLKDTRARFTVNHAAGTSGARIDVPLDEGRINTINVSVTAEDGAHSSSVALSVRRLALNTRVWVLNGMGGVPVENTVLTLTDNRGRVLAGDVALPREKNGKAVFALDPKAKYNIHARGDDAARACYANFDPAKEDTAALYCLRNSTAFFELEAPAIEEIAFASANATGADWKTMPNDAYYVGPLAGVHAVRVTALTRNLIAGSATPFSAIIGVPVRVNVDEVASENSGAAIGVTATAISTNTPVTVDGRRHYRSVYRCALPLITADVFNKGHYVSIVVYDCLGNRTEQRVYLTITNSANGVATDPDLSGTMPTWNLAQAQTFTGGGDLAGRPGHEADAMDPVDPYNGYQQVVTQFFVRSGSTNLPVRGYEVWRSLGGPGDHVRIATVNFASPTTGNPFQYIDRTPSLVAGEAHYRVRAFTGNPANQGMSQFSAPIRAMVLPPTTTGPAPSHEMVSRGLWPTFRIAPSNPLMLAKGADGGYANTDYFYFTLFVKNASDPYPFLLVPMQLRFVESETLAGYGPGDPESQHRFGFPPGRPTALFRHVDYWWDSGVSGDWYYACDATGDEDNPYEPFIRLDDDGSVAIDTASATFQWTMNNYVRDSISGNRGEGFLPGATYLWNLFGANGGIHWSNWDNPMYWTPGNTGAAYFAKGHNANGVTYLGIAYGSHQNYGYGSPAGWFPLIIAADAE